MPNYFDPSKSMNAFASGAQMGSYLRQGKTDRMVAPKVAAGDYKGAMQISAERGDLQGVQQYRDIIGQLGEQERQQAAQRTEQLARVAAGARNLPYEQRKPFLQSQANMLAGMDIPVEAIDQFDPTDEAINGIIQQVTPMADLLKVQMPEYGFMNVDGQLYRTNKTQGTADPLTERRPEGPMSPFGKLVADLNAGRISQAQFDAEVQGRATRGSTNVTVNNAGSEGQRPIINKPPAGYQYRYDDGAGTYTAERIPGSEPWDEQASSASAAQQRVQSRLARAQLVSDKIDQAIEQSVQANTGPVMGRNPLATNLQSTLDTIQAVIGFDELARMRDESPTGGALGQVTEREIALLQSVLGSVSRAQSEQQLDANLKEVKRQIKSSFDNMRRAYEDDVRNGLYGPPPQQSTSAPDNAAAQSAGAGLPAGFREVQ